MSTLSVHLNINTSNHNIGAPDDNNIGALHIKNFDTLDNKIGEPDNNISTQDVNNISNPISTMDDESLYVIHHV